MIDHDGEPQTEMGVFLSKTCRSVWNSVFDRLINLIRLKARHNSVIYFHVLAQVAQACYDAKGFVEENQPVVLKDHNNVRD